MTRNKKARCNKCKIRSDIKIYNNSIGTYILFKKCGRKFKYKHKIRDTTKNKALIKDLNYTIADAINKKLQT